MFKAENLSSNFRFFGRSAMEEKIASGILMGRPFGGAGIFVKSSLSKFVNYSTCKEKFCAVVIEKTVLICVYSPSYSNTSSEDIVELFASIDDLLCDYPNHSVICGGDFNTNLFNSCQSAEVIFDFSQRYKLVLHIGNSCNVNNESLNYIYKHNSLPGESYIDFFLVSQDIACAIEEFSVLEHPVGP